MNPEQTERLEEIQRRLEMLDPQDRLVLTALREGRFDPAYIAADTFILPRLVEESMAKLEELGFLTQDEKKGRLVFTQNGTDAQIIAPLFHDSD